MSDEHQAAGEGAAAPSPGAAKAESFAGRVRIGHSIENLRALHGKMGALELTMLASLDELRRLKAEAAAIADALAKERG
ncbi:hypothetical protein IVB45_17375 [Bradyrhizobium sp. 4]|uniref:hypothetical protein n=1 Tax=unclassified Bradyrhizobium TaxID=2631580 RepID=UPI001FFA4445|nr:MULTISPECIES: hypothetical protein [unclassified Bradyrhizobium]MCK1402054.1 hypothetical protein [Bradyrhizobium sp. 39]MCK1751226.1 hypothetical protein [Bradyrhizobium sp. 135]UPJ38482.1 hypothetical protein IVB45_17375 [Bradyrhizobium sp. 4]